MSEKKTYLVIYGKTVERSEVYDGSTVNPFVIEALRRGVYETRAEREARELKEGLSEAVGLTTDLPATPRTKRRAM